MSSSKQDNNIKMSSKYSIFSQLSNESESDSDNEEVKMNKKEPIKEPVKEPIKEPIKEEHVKPIIKNNNNGKIESDGWENVSHVKNKKPNKYKNNTQQTPINIQSPTFKKYESKSQVNYDNLVQDEQLENIINKDNIEKEMKELKFQNKWYVWVHEIDSKDWGAKSYKIAHTIENLWEFWQFFNNTYLLNQWKFNFFIMKSSSHPTWEHSTNRNGGTCSIRIDISQSIEILEQLSILLVNESLTDEINDINGISFAAKGNWCVIKIWNKDYKNNISNQIPSYLRKIYPSISIKYKENIPEY